MCYDQDVVDDDDYQEDDDIEGDDGHQLLCLCRHLNSVAVRDTGRRDVLERID